MPARRLPHPLAAGASLVALAVACGTPHVDGAAGTSPAPNAVWQPPAVRESTAVRPAPAAPALPPGVAERVGELTLGDIVDIALSNNLATRITWQNARSAAYAYGSAKGQWYPTFDLGVSGTQTRAANSSGVGTTRTSVGGPVANLSWLLFDFGGRSGSIGVAKQSLIAADWTHNGAIEDIVLQVQIAYFNYVANRALREAQLQSIREAQTNVDVTEERHRQGLATIADVLQAKTQLSQAQLALETTEGSILITRGALANAMGLPANAPYDVAAIEPLQIGVVTDSLDALIDRAIHARPDLAASRAAAQGAAARVTEVRAARLPSLQLNATGGHSYFNTLVSENNIYTLNLALKIPFFSGFSREYDQKQAESEAQAASARAESVRQQVVLDVFTAYYSLQTAARRVRTADDLLASAVQSEEVALGRYKAGVGSILDLLTAQSALADARAQQIGTRWEWRTALAVLARNIGVLDVHGESPLKINTDTSATPR